MDLIRRLVILDVVLFVTNMVLWPLGFRQPLSDFDFDFELINPVPEFQWLSIGGLVNVALLIVSWIGLFLFQRWARITYLLVWVATLLADPFTGFQVSHGVYRSFTTLTAIVGGIILAMSFTSLRFQREAKSSREPTETEEAEQAESPKP